MVLSEKDEIAIENQLGRVPRGVLKITNYTEDGEPLVILTDPILPDGKPFPTIFYLTHSRYVKAISRLEDKGLIKVFEQKVISNKDLGEQFLGAQKSYINERIRLAGDRLDKLNENERDILEQTGIGGVRDLSTIKCLHAHYAHYLARKNNPIGKEIEKELDEKSCN